MMRGMYLSERIDLDQRLAAIRQAQDTILIQARTLIHAPSRDVAERLAEAREAHEHALRSLIGSSLDQQTRPAKA